MKHNRLPMQVIACALLLILFLLPSISHAQPPIFDDDVNDVPIDGGLSLLAAAGVGYGANKLKRKKASKHSAVNKNIS